MEKTDKYIVTVTENFLVRATSKEDAESKFRVLGSHSFPSKNPVITNIKTIENA